MLAPRAGPVLLVLLVLLLAGCQSSGPEATPAALEAATASSAPPAAPPDLWAGLRPCLGPWTGSGSFDIVWPVGWNGPQDVPVVNVTEPGVALSVWLDSDPAYEGQAVLTPTDQRDGPEDLVTDGSGTVQINLTGDPASGTGDVPAGAYDFTFQPEHDVEGRHTAAWTVEIREVPRLGAPNCRPAEAEGAGTMEGAGMAGKAGVGPRVERLHALHAKPEAGGPPAAPLPENG